MFRALNEAGEFVSYGFYTSLKGRTFAVVPNYGDAVADEGSAVPFGALVKVSARHGFRAYEATSSRSYEVEEFLDASTALSSVCVVGAPEDGRYVAFAHWYLTSAGAYQIRFAQSSDPRLNGMPVTNRKTGKIVCMYLVHSWFDEPGRGIPSDLLVPGKDENPRSSARVADLELERNDWFGPPVAHASKKGGLPPPARGLALGDYVFCETPDGRAKWVACATPQRVVREEDPVFLRDPFSVAVEASKVRWSTGAELVVIPGKPRELFLFGRPPPIAASTPSPPPPLPEEEEEEGGATWL